MLDLARNLLNNLKKTHNFLWTTLVLSYAYYINMSPAFLPFPMGSLFGLDSWQHLMLLYARNLFVLASLLTVFIFRRRDWRHYDLMLALLFLTASEAMCVYCGLPWVALLVRFLMSAGLALAMLALSDVLACLHNGRTSEWVYLGISYGIMHVLTDCLSYSLSAIMQHAGWLFAFRLLALFGLFLCCVQLFVKSSWVSSVFLERERLKHQHKPHPNWRLLTQDSTARLALIWIVFLSIPVMYISSEMGFYSFHHLQKKTADAIFTVKTSFAFGWLVGFLICYTVNLAKRMLPYCMTLCSIVMVLTSIITLFLKPLTHTASLFVMFFMGVAFSGVVLAFRVFRLRFKPYDSYRLFKLFFLALSFAGVLVSVLVFVMLLIFAFVAGGFHNVNLNTVLEGLMFTSPITSLFAVLLSFYIGPFKCLTLSDEPDSIRQGVTHA